MGLVLSVALRVVPQLDWADQLAEVSLIERERGDIV